MAPYDGITQKKRSLGQKFDGIKSKIPIFTLDEANNLLQIE